MSVPSAKVLKAARVLACLSQAELALMARVGHATVSRAEGGAGGTSLENVKRIIAALEQAGVRFLPETKRDGEGVRLAKAGASGRMRSKRE